MPVQEIPLDINYEGPKVKFHNQRPADIAQEGIIGGSVTVYKDEIMKSFPKFS
ncbi:hypothetical protein LNQ81_00805 [Myroides sp. M-43]|uniref:hypothetical protein n=1 Tax=Myroides oncorhynchi TaxID=2893756 RepID=UPI001E339696|nr:hypothetical protein [Myroides oncorhynchi]MCC9041274.1 hypothetical protein [Myroides oncorhynchi]